jgi:hypothetical protein
MSTRYTVVTTPIADNQLAAVWLNAPGERAAISRASHQVGLTLREDAHQKGTPAPVAGFPSRRYLEEYPLGVYFEVSEPDRLVRILGFVHLSPPP